ncbi:hypothetical protein WG907_06150 [Sphingobium sp. AN558]|uniref:hypothetical protein n=1 Tax=Sphingobium sp. AN558 TaxID=3133442 RepID=UPI0030C0D500
MPKMNDRERLAKLEIDQHKLAQEAEAVRRALRAHYGALTADIAVEQLTEREFREIVTQAILIGGSPAISALKAHLPAPASSKDAPERRPRDEHGGAARKRPAPSEGAASPGDGASQ